MKPVMLIILDGWGIREMQHGNAIAQANVPNFRRWLTTTDRSILDASGEAVGLVPEQMGNSEVGHLNLGAGRIVYQDISAINVSIKENTLGIKPGLLEAFETVRRNNSKLHLIGLLSDGGVHSHENHLYALLKITQQHGINPVIHVITDGRDTPPNSGIHFVRKLEDFISLEGQGMIATVSGRYYAMDRDKRWERTLRAYNAMAYRDAEEHAATATEAVMQSYAKNVTDEFILPTVIGDNDNLKIAPGDVLLFYNFRADRMRQIVQGFSIMNSAGFEEQKQVENLKIVTFTEYDPVYPVSVLFGKEILNNTLAETLSNAGKKQYHSAETEKYPHVTYFFNGRKEQPFEGEDRRIIPSPKVATYDLQPEMSAQELTDATLERLRDHDDDFLLVNFANPDMVGHTGSLEAAKRAVEFVDSCAGKLVEALNAKGGVAIVTADHGNAEVMVNEVTGDPHTYHTTNPVSLFLIGDRYFPLRPRGILADVAPTVLDLLGVPQPTEMTGVSLIDHSS